MYRKTGFSLIELLVTVVLLGIMASLAIPAYTAYVQAARRADARLALVQVSSQLEKFYSDNLGYTSNLGALGFVSAYSPERHYTISVAGVSNSGYRVVATAVADGKQGGDVSCTSFSLDSSGRQAALDADGADATDECW